MTKQIAALLSLLGGTVLLFILAHLFSPTQEPSYVIGVLSTSQHTALDLALEGFKQKLITKLHNNVKFIEFSGKDNDHLNNAARLLTLNETIQAFFVLGSPACHALISQEKHRPIIFAAVSDPTLHTLQKSNVCGISDRTHKDLQVKLIKRLVPSVKKMGILYTSDEMHTQEYLEELMKAMKKENIVPRTINLREKDPQRHYNKLDALFILEDNTIAHSMKDLAKQALENKKPLFASYTPAVQEGAIAAQGVNYHACGRIAGKYVLKLLKKQLLPEEIGIIQSPNSEILINKDVCKKLKISIPSDLIQYERSTGEQIP